MLRDMRDVVRLTMTNRGYAISAITTEATAHVVDMIKKTTNSKKRYVLLTFISLTLLF